MQEKEFDKLDELVEMVNDKIHKLYEEGTFIEITNKIKEVSRTIGEDYSVTVDFQVNAFDSTKEKSLSALTIGISSSRNDAPLSCIWRFFSLPVFSRWRYKKGSS